MFQEEHGGGFQVPDPAEQGPDESEPRADAGLGVVHVYAAKRRVHRDGDAYQRERHACLQVYDIGERAR